MIKNFLTLIFCNFIHIFLFFFIPFQLITKILEPNGFLSYTFFCILISIWSIIQGVMYIILLKKWFPNLFQTIIKEIENV